MVYIFLKNIDTLWYLSNFFFGIKKMTLQGSLDYFLKNLNLHLVVFFKFSD